MKFAKSLLMGTGGVALAGLLLSLLAPKVAQGLVAALVQVANTSSAPAIASLIDDPGRVAYGATSSNYTCAGAECTFYLSAVPAGRRVVIQHMSGLLHFLSAPANVSGTIGQVVGGFNTYFSLPITGPNLYFDQPTLTYFDAGAIPEITISGDVVFHSGGVQSLTLVGYELDCTAAPCAAIANQ